MRFSWEDMHGRYQRGIGILYWLEVLREAGLKNIVLGSSPCIVSGFRSEAGLLEKDSEA